MSMREKNEGKGKERDLRKGGERKREGGEKGKRQKEGRRDREPKRFSCKNVCTPSSRSASF